MKEKQQIQQSVEGFSENGGSISVIAEFDANEEHLMSVEVKDQTIPILPLRNMVLFPGVFMPVSIGRKSSLKLIREAEKSGGLFAVLCQKQTDTEEPTLGDLHAVGTVARITRVLQLPDRTTTAILQGVKRVEVHSITDTEPYLRGTFTLLEDQLTKKTDKEFQVLVESIKEAVTRYVRTSETFPQDSAFAIKNLGTNMYLVNFIANHLPLKKDDKIELLGIGSVKDRAFRLLEMLNQEVQLAEIKASIQTRAREDIDQQQREYFLQQQIKTIQNELGTGGSGQEVEELRAKAGQMKWSDEIRQAYLKEVDRLERTPQQSPDYNVQVNYLRTMTSLPWGTYTTDAINIAAAEKCLNHDHYGLEKVKERILEHLAVLKLRGDLKSPIICLYGPPGVGKTSLGKSIATALKRKYVRISLGGVHDEAEIRGHRRTYIGAMPGRIISGLIKAGSSNPVFVLDEIDKVGSDRQGDPSSALLEVLDPEQNSAFHDNYLDVDYDLSKIMFIATANDLSTIPQPLLDRMELIKIPGYLTEEKIEIAKRHLIPKQLDANGMKKGDVKFTKQAIEGLIENYTIESGVRELEKKIGKILRRQAYTLAKTGAIEKATIQAEDLHEFLGTEEYTRDRYQGNEYAGVVTGLAWTAAGGEILFIESSIHRGKGGLTLTGNLGDVMKESAMLALEFIKAHPQLLGLDSELFNHWDIHIHVPEGATPKDGPSAGITLATAIASLLTQRKVKAGIAMTGEITLRGKVLMVGGIREKILAAKRAGIREIILCKDNRRHIEEIPQKYVEGLTFHYVSDVREVLSLALTDELVANPLDLTVLETDQKTSSKDEES